MSEQAEIEARAAELAARWADWAETVGGIDQALPALWADYAALQAATARLRSVSVDPGPQTARLIRKIAVGESLLRDGR